MLYYWTLTFHVSRACGVQYLCMRTTGVEERNKHGSLMNTRCCLFNNSTIMSFWNVLSNWMKRKYNTFVHQRRFSGISNRQVWKALTLLCGVVSSLCGVVSSCVVVPSLCLAVTSLSCRYFTMLCGYFIMIKSTHKLLNKWRITWRWKSKTCNQYIEIKGFIETSVSLIFLFS